jgi:hypothetical protein
MVSVWNGRNKKKHINLCRPDKIIPLFVKTTVVISAGNLEKGRKKRHQWQWELEESSGTSLGLATSPLVSGSPV